MSLLKFLDVRTLMTGYVVSMLICIVVLAALWFQNRDRFGAIGFWLAALILQFFSLLLILARGAMPEPAAARNHSGRARVQSGREKETA